MEYTHKYNTRLSRFQQWSIATLRPLTLNYWVTINSMNLSCCGRVACNRICWHTVFILVMFICWHTVFILVMFICWHTVFILVMFICWHTVFLLVMFIIRNTIEAVIQWYVFSVTYCQVCQETTINRWRLR